MTLAALPRVIEYAGQASPATCPVPFQFFGPEELSVKLRDAVGNEAVEASFTVAGGNGSTGTVTFAGSTAGLTIVIRGATTVDQQQAIPEGGDFPTKAVERAFDRAAAIDQEQADGLKDVDARAIMVPPGEIAPVLAPLTSRIGGKKKILGIDQASGVVKVQEIDEVYRGPAGLAANTFSSLAELAAASTVEFKSATIVGIAGLADGLLVYESANAPYTLGPNVFQADVPLTVGAWVRQRAQGLVTRRSDSGATAAEATAQQRLDRQEVRLEDFGGSGNGITTNDAALAAILNHYATANTDGRIAGIDIRFGRNGLYLFASPIAIAALNVTLVGENSEIRYNGDQPFIDIGSADYLTDLGAGYYRVQLDGLVIRATNPACPRAIRVRGMRAFALSGCRVLGGIYGLECEGIYGMGLVEDTTFQGQSSRGVSVLRRNNIMRLLKVNVLGVGGGAGTGYYFESLGAENQGIYLLGCDAEGCLLGYSFNGSDLGPVVMDTCWSESNVSSIAVNNENATNKYGIVVRGGQYDSAITFGSVSTTGNLLGCHIGGGVKLTNAVVTINVAAGVTVGDVCKTGSSVIIYNTPSGEPQRLATGGLASAAETMPRYRAGHEAPFASGDTRGPDGDLRWDGGHVYVRTGPGAWRRLQSARFEDGGMPQIGIGQPNVGGFRSAMVGSAGEGTISKLPGGMPGDLLTLVGGNGVVVTVVANSDIKLPGNANISLADNDVLSLICFAPDRWAAASSFINNAA